MQRTLTEALEAAESLSHSTSDTLPGAYQYVVLLGAEVKRLQHLLDPRPTDKLTDIEVEEGAVTEVRM